VNVSSRHSSSSKSRSSSRALSSESRHTQTQVEPSASSGTLSDLEVVEDVAGSELASLEGSFALGFSGAGCFDSVVAFFAA